MKILKLLLALTIFFSLAACSDDDNGNNPSGSAKQLIPLKLGNYWDYKETCISNSVIITHTEYVALQTEALGMSCYLIETDIGDDFVFYTNKPDGFYLVNPFDPNIQWLEYKYPCNVGDQFITREGDPPIIVESISYKITVPAGTFTCIQYTQYYTEEIPGHESNLRFTRWLCPGVGVIKTEWAYKYPSNSDYKPENIKELASFSL